MKFDKWGYLFIAPFFIAYFIFGLYPAINTFRLAFYQYDMNMPTNNFVGLQYVIRALNDPLVYKGIFNAIKFWAIGTLFVQFTAILVAAVFTFFKVRGAHLFKSIFYLPSIVSSAVVATIFSLFMGYPAGFVNTLIVNWGIVDEPIYLLGNPIIIFCLVIFISWWMGYGGTSITAGAGMTSISDELYESAKIDGASFPQIFRKITIPLIWPVLTYMWMTSLIYGLQAFDIQFMLTNSAGGPDGVAQTIAMYIYKHGFEVGNVGYSAGISIVFFIVIVILSIIMLTALQRREK